MGVLLAIGLLPGAARAAPLISELFYDAAGSDAGQLFVELWGQPGTVLDGLVLEGVNGSNGAVGPVISLSGEIQPDGLFVVADSDAEGVSGVLEADQLARFDFQNGPDSVVLRDGDRVLDAVAYGVFAPDEVSAGEGTPAPDAPAGASLARLFADVDSDDNALDFVVLDVPTPGSARVSSVPEPSGLALACTATAGLWWAGRRRR